MTLVHDSAQSPQPLTLRCSEPGLSVVVQSWRPAGRVAELGPLAEKGRTMHTSEESEKLRTRLSKWRNTRAAAAWILAATLVLVVVQIVMLAQGRGNLAQLTSTVSGAIIFFSIALLAKKKIQTIAHELSS